MKEHCKNDGKICFQDSFSLIFPFLLPLSTISSYLCIVILILYIIYTYTHTCTYKHTHIYRYRYKYIFPILLSCLYAVLFCVYQILLKGNYL